MKRSGLECDRFGRCRKPIGVEQDRLAPFLQRSDSLYRPRFCRQAARIYLAPVPTLSFASAGRLDLANLAVVIDA